MVQAAAERRGVTIKGRTVAQRMKLGIRGAINFFFHTKGQVAPLAYMPLGRAGEFSIRYDVEFLYHNENKEWQTKHYHYYVSPPSSNTQEVDDLPKQIHARFMGTVNPSSKHYFFLPSNVKVETDSPNCTSFPVEEEETEEELENLEETPPEEDRELLRAKEQAITEMLTGTTQSKPVKPHVPEEPEAEKAELLPTPAEMAEAKQLARQALQEMEESGLQSETPKQTAPAAAATSAAPIAEASTAQPQQERIEHKLPGFAKIRKQLHELKRSAGESKQDTIPKLWDIAADESPELESQTHPEAPVGVQRTADKIRKKLEESPEMPKKRKDNKIREVRGLGPENETAAVAPAGVKTSEPEAAAPVQPEVTTPVEAANVEEPIVKAVTDTIAEEAKRQHKHPSVDAITKTLKELGMNFLLPLSVNLTDRKIRDKMGLKPRATTKEVGVSGTTTKEVGEEASLD
eukprot:GHVQ01022781.1.p1 GENE.GHVQ01022781.1~~GHVQ01022781.1.p1  ORF type:complete len:461 (+),score=77.02 GHVQ01022781.1:397-1779(+)